MFVFQEMQELLFDIVFQTDVVANIRAVKTGDELLCCVQIESADDFLPGSGISGGGQGNAGNVGKQFMQQLSCR